VNFFSLTASYFLSRLSITSQSWFGLPNDNPRKRFWFLLTRLETLWKYAVFANFLLFLCDGKFVSIQNRILNLRLLYMNTAARSVSFEYMTRQLVWNGFSEFMIFIMRLFNSSSSSFQNYLQALGLGQ
jgi:peroxin-2